MKLHLSEDVRDLIKKVNTDLNKKITYQPDIEQHDMLEKWQDGRITGKEDCDGYAVAKYLMLKENGVPEDSMGVCTCFVDGDSDRGHAVLVISTTEGFLVLDNRYDSVMEKGDLPYTWNYIPENIIND